MPARLLVVGLDGATFDLIQPWLGDLPHLAGLMASGAWCPLRSTLPPATFPAWTSLMTGVNPGRHGVFDFTRRVPGTYRVEFINVTYRRCPSAWQIMSRAGLRVAVIGLPATYPPEEVNGLFISGFDSPVATGIDRSFVRPAHLYDEIRRAVGAYEITDFQELRIGPGWHEMALEKLLHAARRRADIATYLLDREPWDCFFVHFGESDTVAHHFWAFHDPASPRHDASRAADLGHAIHTVYQALGRVVGVLLDAAQPDTVLILSDHGSGGAGRGLIHLNRWLAQQGWLAFAPAGAVKRAASRLKRLGLALPASLQEWAFRGPLRPLVGRLESRARLAGIDWARTRAFSEEVNTLPGIWLNVRGREPLGTVEPGREYEALRDEIRERLLAWRHPDSGQPLVAHAWRREEVYHGPAIEEAPDLLLEFALDKGYTYTLLSGGGRPGPALSTLPPDEFLGAKGSSMNGSHRPEGILILAGAGVRSGVRLGGAQIVDVAPTLLHLLDVPLPAGLDGRVLEQALLPGVRIVAGQSDGAPAEGDDPPLPRPYTADQAALVGDRLRGLGYRV